MDPTLLTLPLAAVALLALVAVQRGWKPRWLPTLPLSAKAQLSVVQRTALTPQHALHVIDVDGQRLLVATYPNGCRLLRTLDPAGPDSRRPA